MCQGRTGNGEPAPSVGRLTLSENNPEFNRPFSNKPNRMSRRSRSREVALQVLFEDDLNPVDPRADPSAFLHRRLKGAALVDFSNSLIGGVRQHRDELDSILETSAENWTVSRMATTDRNVLRLAAFEILYLKTAGPVVIDEAVELAKRFGSAQSSQFVNGILDRVLNDQHPSEEGDREADRPQTLSEGNDFSG